MANLEQVKKAQPKWFSVENKKFFHDVDYCILHGKSNKPFLVRSTYAWTDMFGQKPRLHYRVNPLNEMLQIEPLIDDEFADIDDVEEWLKDN